MEWTDQRIAELQAYRRGGLSHQQIAEIFGVTRQSVKRAWQRLGDREVPPVGKTKKADPSPGFLSGNRIVLVSRPDNTYLFGVVGDKHYGSKYHRDDVVVDLFNRFERAGVDAIFDTGNWIDGEARFNRHDLLVHGLDPQIRFMASEHPKADVPIFAVWGDDHEGWYASREGIDVGDYAEHRMREAGHDWTNLGFMEAHLTLRNANTRTETILCVMHPGGGSAYALSYRPQKIVEALDGGEKPAVILMGHYHKLEVLNIRNVWTLQSGCAQDQTPFMRKKSIQAHVGGAILGMEQDPETGAIIGFSPQLIRYFNQGFYNNRWSKHGDISRTERIVGAV
jgi:uncharacterized protein (DUF433 family)